MRIGILGTRGIPNQYGGFEQLAEYLSVGLVSAGHEVYVYNSSLHTYKEKLFKGVHIISCYDPENKIGTAGQFIYDLNCILDARKRKYDVLLQLGYTSSSVWHFLLPASTVIITNMDGMEWKRSKYGSLTKLFLKKAEQWAVESSHFLVADSLGIQKYLSGKYKRDSTYIAYGATVFNTPDNSVLAKYNLTPQQYYLLIARFEPENNIEMIIQGYLQSNDSLPLLLIGSFQNKFGTYLKNKYEQKNVKFLGAIYNLNELNNLRFYSKLYFHGHSVGGTNPSLLEAMASGAFICAHDNVFNKTILESDALYFSDTNDIKTILQSTITIKSISIENNKAKIEKLYAWPKIISQYEELMLKSNMRE